MDLPYENNIDYIKNNSCIKLFINHIFSNGVLGNRYHITSFSTKILHQNYNRCD